MLKKQYNNIIIFLFMLILFIYQLFNGLNVIELFATFIVLIGAKIIRTIFNLEISDKLETIYIVFIFLAQFFGVTLHFYKVVNHYDKFVHFYFGILMSLFAVVILQKFCIYLYNKFSKLFIISFTSLVAVLWEITEFIYNFIVHTDPQKVISTGVSDTMVDLVVALLGSIIIITMLSFKKGKRFLNSIIN